MLGKWVRSLLIPARVICWQSYSSILSRLWQLFRCSSEASVISGQLSSSTTSRRSWAQVPLPRCRMPSSVISSQCDKLRTCRRGQWIDSCSNVLSVICTHSSRSIFSSSWQFLASVVKPTSVSWEQRATSSILSLAQFCPSAFSIASVILEQPEAHNDCSLWQPRHIVIKPSSVICEQVCRFNVTSSGQWAPMCFNASSSSCVHPFRKRAFSPPQPLTSAWIPSLVTWSHQEMFSCSSSGHPSLSAFKDMLDTEVQDARSSCLSLEQNLLRLAQVASVILVQPFRFNSSIFLQFCAKVLSALSPTPRQPRRLSFLRKPPHRFEMFSTTRPSMSRWKSNKSILCQLLPSRARTFQARDTWAQRQSVTTSRNENILSSSSLGNFLLMRASSLFENISNLLLVTPFISLLMVRLTVCGGLGLLWPPGSSASLHQGPGVRTSAHLGVRGASSTLAVPRSSSAASCPTPRDPTLSGHKSESTLPSPLSPSRAPGRPVKPWRVVLSMPRSVSALDTPLRLFTPRWQRPPYTTKEEGLPSLVWDPGDTGVFPLTLSSLMPLPQESVLSSQGVAALSHPHSAHPLL